MQLDSRGYGVTVLLNEESCGDTYIPGPPAIGWFSSVQSLSRVRIFATPWTAARQASLSITNSWRLFKLMSIKLVKSSNHLIFCHPLLLLPSIFPSIRVFSNESLLRIRWPKYQSFSNGARVKLKSIKSTSGSYWTHDFRQRI